MFEGWKAKGQENECGVGFFPTLYPIEQQGICAGMSVMVVLTPERHTFVHLNSTKRTGRRQWWLPAV